MPLPRNQADTDPRVEPTRKIDSDHLARQTGGDLVLQKEVLQLFLRQLDEIGPRLDRSEPDELRSLAHTLKGSARGIGAMHLAQNAEELEAEPGDRQRLLRLVSAARAVRSELNILLSDATYEGDPQQGGQPGIEPV